MTFRAALSTLPKFERQISYTVPKPPLLIMRTVSQPGHTGCLSILHTPFLLIGFICRMRPFLYIILHFSFLYKGFSIFCPQAVPGLHYSEIIACALIYNGMAFAFQLPIGTLGDKPRKTGGLASLGCILIASEAAIPFPILFIGQENACFHLGRGREVLTRSGTSASCVGIFVAPGALGIFLGPKLAAPGIGFQPLLAFSYGRFGPYLDFLQKALEAVVYF